MTQGDIIALLEDTSDKCTQKGWLHLANIIYQATENCRQSDKACSVCGILVGEYIVDGKQICPICLGK